eukprot:TRINITY_DN359_c1_g1_i1.p1 TRINITY_DN359_c1_g1~~TRINITY_DN359_c1_g1_i1.p1  ORF type:complete len:986 (+),score=228.81 TRINITY_DN359_c1_g1_i1:26-2959(+)
MELQTYEVIANVYDLTIEQTSLTKLNRSTLSLGFGAFHAGVVVHGKEFSFGGKRGIHAVDPGQSMNGILRSSLKLGFTTRTSSDVEYILGLLREKFMATSYQVSSHNCNDFCNAFLRELGVPTLPPWVNRLARFAGFIDFLLPKKDSVSALQQEEAQIVRNERLRREQWEEQLQSMEQRSQGSRSMLDEDSKKRVTVAVHATIVGELSAEDNSTEGSEEKKEGVAGTEKVDEDARMDGKRLSPEKKEPSRVSVRSRSTTPPRAPYGAFRRFSADVALDDPSIRATRSRRRSPSRSRSPPSRIIRKTLDPKTDKAEIASRMADMLNLPRGKSSSPRQSPLQSPRSDTSTKSNKSSRSGKSDKKKDKVKKKSSVESTLDKDDIAQEMEDMMNIGGQNRKESKSNLPMDVPLRKSKTNLPKKYSTEWEQRLMELERKASLKTIMRNEWEDALEGVNSRAKLLSLQKAKMHAHLHTTLARSEEELQKKLSEFAESESEGMNRASQESLTMRLLFDRPNDADDVLDGPDVAEESEREVETFHRPDGDFQPTNRTTSSRTHTSPSLTSPRTADDPSPDSKMDQLMKALSSPSPAFLSPRSLDATSPNLNPHQKDTKKGWHAGPRFKGTGGERYVDFIDDQQPFKDPELEAFAKILVEPKTYKERLADFLENPQHQDTRAALQTTNLCSPPSSPPASPRNSSNNLKRKGRGISSPELARVTSDDKTKEKEKEKEKARSEKHSSKKKHNAHVKSLTEVDSAELKAFGDFLSNPIAFRNAMPYGSQSVPGLPVSHVVNTSPRSASPRSTKSDKEKEKSRGKQIKVGEKKKAKEGKDKEKSVKLVKESKEGKLSKEKRKSLGSSLPNLFPKRSTEIKDKGKDSKKPTTLFSTTSSSSSPSLGKKDLEAFATFLENPTSYQDRFANFLSNPMKSQSRAALHIQSDTSATPTPSTAPTTPTSKVRRELKRAKSDGELSSESKARERIGE